MASASFSTKRSWTPLWTRKRLEQMHVCHDRDRGGVKAGAPPALRPLQHSTWPEFRNLEAMAPPTALSTSALSNTMKGAWPPSSMETLFTVSAAIFSSNCNHSPAVAQQAPPPSGGRLPAGPLTLPVAVEPVKEILATSGWVQRTSPTDGAFSLEQGTTLKTPAGTPACSASCPRRGGRKGQGVSGSGQCGWLSQQG